MRLNYQIVVAKINGKTKILVADDIGTSEFGINAMDLSGKKYELIWELNDKRMVELYLKDTLLTPLYTYLPKQLKNTEVCYCDLKKIESKINKESDFIL